MDQADALEDGGATAVTVESRAALAATAARRVAASAKVSEVMAPLVAEPTAGQTGVVAAAAVAEMAAVPLGRCNRASISCQCR